MRTANRCTGRRAPGKGGTGRGEWDGNFAPGFHVRSLVRREWRPDMVSDRAVGDDIARGVSAMPANTILIDIDPDDCVDLLGSAPIGRLGVVVHGHPEPRY